MFRKKQEYYSISPLKNSDERVQSESLGHRQVRLTLVTYTQLEFDSHIHLKLDFGNILNSNKSMLVLSLLWKKTQSISLLSCISIHMSF